jgi:hypothetical protein
MEDRYSDIIWRFKQEGGLPLDAQLQVLSLDKINTIQCQSAVTAAVRLLLLLSQLNTIFGQNKVF